jgi:hypothetical protein
MVEGLVVVRQSWQVYCLIRIRGDVIDVPRRGRHEP